MSHSQTNQSQYCFCGILFGCCTKRVPIHHQYRVTQHIVPINYRSRITYRWMNSKRPGDVVMKLNILGCHSATPLENAHTTSQVLEVKEHLFLIDCGEGTQIQLRQQKIKFSRIKHIFISHLHGDHFYGLVGLISTFRLLCDSRSSYLWTQKESKRYFHSSLNWPTLDHHLFFHELETKNRY